MSTPTVPHDTHRRQRDEQRASSTRQPNEPRPVPREHQQHGLRPAGQQPVLSTRARVRESDSAHFIQDALEDIRAYMQEHHIHPAGPPFARCRSTGAGTLDIETGWLLERPVQGSGRIHAASLPTTLIRHDTARRPRNRESAPITL